jgi:hypothetical protein
MSGISPLHKKRDDLLECISVISFHVDKYEKSGFGRDVELLKKYKIRIDDIWNQVTDVQKEIVDVNKEEPTDLPDAQQKYSALVERLTNLIDNVRLSPIPATSSDVSPAVTRQISMESPIIPIPIFDGTIENWKSFYDVFHATVDQNNQLTSVEKFRYLQSFLTKKAAKSIESLVGTENNYSNAIAILKEKFHCPPQICLRHWNEILKYPKLTKETPEAIQSLIDTVNVHLRMLKNLGQAITSDIVIIGVVLSKLSPETVHQWELTLPDSSFPSYLHLLDFLRKRANCIMYSIANAKKVAMKQNRAQQKAPLDQIYIAMNVTPQCPICGGPHTIYNCNTFLAKSIRDRITAARKALICTNCLRKGHFSPQCFAIGSCRVCGQHHHTLLHLYKTEFKPQLGIKKQT